MIDTETLRAIPALHGKPELAKRLAAYGREIELQTRDRAFTAGDDCRGFVFLIDGALKVRMISETGREIVLYRVLPGETCVLTTACLLSGDIYPAEAIAEEPCRLLLVPRGEFDDLMSENRAFRTSVLEGFGQRLSMMMATLDRAVFRPADSRIAQHLLDAARDGRLQATHQDIAADIGSAREVVSRHLKEFERRGLIRLGRGEIVLLRPDDLRAIAEL